MHTFRSKIDGIMDVIWSGGLASHTAVIELIIYLVFLRELWTHDIEQKQLDEKYTPLLSGDLALYKWDNLLSLNADVLFGHLNDAFEKLARQSTNKTVQNLYNKAHVKLYDRPALRTVVHRIEELMKEVGEEERIHRADFFGDLYEYLLSKISAAGTGGQFRTPRHIIKFIVEAIDPSANESICDPACGTAGFLVAALEHLKQKYTSEEFQKENRFPMDKLTDSQRRFLYNQAFTGFDSDEDMIKFGLMNLYFHRLEKATIKRRNTLTETQGETTKWDIILANPPFAGKVDREGVAEELQMNTKATEVLFLNYMIRHTTDRGRCGVIVPEGVIFQSARAYADIRKKLVEDAGLIAVVSLPSGVFNPYAGVKTSILFFDKTKKETNTEIAFVKIQNDGFDLGAQRRPNDKSDLPRALDILKNWREGKKVDSEVVLYVEKEKIIESGEYNLSGDRYRPTQEHTGAWPMVELGEILEYEQPTKYIVQSVEYSDEYKIPVLTAGKSFVLGKTNEKEGIFPEESLPVIIFDDFTTATKYVDFQFKVKSSAMKILHAKEGVNIRYVFWMMQNIQFSFSEHKRFWISEYSKIKIPLPPLEIQERIVAELDGYERIISGAEEIIKNYKPSMKVDNNWERVEIGNLLLSTTLGVVKAKQMQSSTFPHPYVKMNNLTKNGALNLENVTYVEATAEELKRYTLNDGDFIYNTRNAPNLVGKSAVYHGKSGRYVFNNNILRIAFKKNVNPDYINYYLNTTGGRKQVEALISGTTSVAAIYQKDFSTISIPLPPIDIQNKIVKKIQEEMSCIRCAIQAKKIFGKKIEEIVKGF